MKEIGTPGVKRDSTIDIEKECGHFLPKVFHPQKEGCFTRKIWMFMPRAEDKISVVGILWIQCFRERRCAEKV